MTTSCPRSCRETAASTISFSAPPERTGNEGRGEPKLKTWFKGRLTDAKVGMYESYPEWPDVCHTLGV